MSQGSRLASRQTLMLLHNCCPCRRASSYTDTPTHTHTHTHTTHAHATRNTPRDLQSICSLHVSQVLCSCTVHICLHICLLSSLEASACCADHRAPVVCKAEAKIVGSCTHCAPVRLKAQAKPWHHHGNTTTRRRQDSSSSSK